MGDTMELREPLLSANQGYNHHADGGADGGSTHGVHAQDRNPDLQHDYHMPPRHEDSEPQSPRDGHNSRVFRNVGGMDEFFSRFYYYFRYRGWLNILLTLIFDMIKQASVRTAPTSSIFGTDCKGNTPIHFDRLQHPSTSVVGVLVVFCLMWTFFLVLRLRRLRGLVQMKDFYENVLQVESAELQTISWSDLEDKLIAAFQEHKFDFKKHTDVLDGWIVKSVIMRKTNGLTRLYSSVLPTALSLPSFPLPFAKHSSTDTKVKYLPRILHETLSRLIDSTVFTSHNGVVRLHKQVSPDEYEVLARHLQLWMRVLGVVMLLFAPFVLLYNAAEFCFTYSDLLRNSPGTFAARQWTHYATWYFRCDNELEHYCKRRLHDAYKPTKSYLDSFASFTLATISRFLQFAAGALFATLFFLALYYDEGFLQLELIRDRSVAWVMTILAVAMGILRGLASEAVEVQSPQAKWEEAKRELVMFEKEWNDNPTHPNTFKAVGNLFDLWAMVVLGELLGIILAPLLLLFRLPAHAPNIVRFYAENFIEVEGLGCHERHVIRRSQTMMDRAIIESKRAVSEEGERGYGLVGSQMRPLPASGSVVDSSSHGGGGESLAQSIADMPPDDRSIFSERRLLHVRQLESVSRVLPRPSDI
ncbi:hypothetical protein PTSG_01997 [Salpingoeca rosetta]|uniref:Autophagy-related protein 9 n=1 Tax=Salpingoeca rosetta (strain ATCC 50818 / BSB-021) TaxID=946362 RepID=F2TZK4_SALR5|nr:uncharacterized protein PTSG_01997 [Salpingoeca rosetta]EGD79028.1 hypothetical protein PTSG_01997 [Salpingoeca rosetta]|eukprot:XP_004997984.1 hypothetical protein PTSG_01997 [Salpingoeca rosetta]